MPVNVTQRTARYDGNGTSDTFPTVFEFFENESVLFWVNKVLQTEGVDYTLTGGAGLPGTVVTTVPPPSGSGNVFIERVVPLTESNDFLPGGAFPSDAADIVHDKLLYRIQELAEGTERTLRIPAFHTATTWDGTLPDPGDPAELPASGVHVIQLTSTGVQIVEVSPTDIANPIVTKGQILTHNGTSPLALGPGADGTALMALASEATGLKYAGAAERLDYLLTTRGDLIRRGASTTERLANPGVASRYLGWDGVDSTWMLPFLQGQGQLAKDGANVRFSRHDGRFVVLNSSSSHWLPFEIPSAGVAISPSGLSMSTLYYLYLFESGGTVTGEASTTAPTIDAETGFWIKGGPDATRLLVGMAQTDGSTQWQDDADARMVRSWFHDPGITARARITVDRTLMGATLAEIHTDFRLDFLVWADELTDAYGNSTVFHDAGADVSQAIGFDGVTADVFSFIQANIATNIETPMLSMVQGHSLSEGAHDFRLLGAVTSGTGTWQANQCAVFLQCPGRPS